MWSAICRSGSWRRRVGTAVLTSFDVGLCFSPHHFEPERAARVLCELWRIARRAVVVTDLTRGYPAYA